MIDIKTIKAELLCLGLRLDISSYNVIANKYPHLLERTLVHAMHIVLYEEIVNVCVSETFCNYSPYSLIYNEKFYLYKGEEQICDVRIIELPSWCFKTINGYQILDYIRPHSDDCLSCSPILYCDYIKNGKICQFCSLSAYGSLKNIKYRLDPNILAKMLKVAFDNKIYDLNFSSGTILTEDKSASYYIDVLKKAELDKYGEQIFVSIEIAPPDTDEYIEDLSKCGVTSLIMNIEIADDNLRKTICPGKSEIPLDRYFKAMKKAVSLLGYGNVSSVLLAGIQPAEDIIMLGSKLIEMGVIPTIMPFKPLDDCLMSNYGITNPEELIQINDTLTRLLHMKGLNPTNQNGCTRCGGCSLETLNFSRMRTRRI